MTTNLDAFINLDKSIKMRVKMSDGTIRETCGKEVVKVKP